MALFIFDFDNTIVNGQTHNIIFSHISEKQKKEQKPVTLSNEEQWNIVKNIPPIGNAEQWKKLFEQIHQQGHKIAVASFNSFGNKIIPNYLREIFHLSPELVNEIFVESWLPKDPNTADKNLHIQNVIKHYNYQEVRASVILIDDSWRNYSAAYNAGYSVIEANQNVDHIADVTTALEKPLSAKNYQDFCNIHKKDAHGLTYGKTFAPLIREAETGIKKDIKTQEGQGFYLIPSHLVESQSRQLKNCFIVTENYEFFSVDQRGLKEKLGISQNELKDIFSKHELSQQFSYLRDISDNLMSQIPDSAMNEINQLLLKAFQTTPVVDTSSQNSSNSSNSPIQTPIDSLNSSPVDTDDEVEEFTPIFSSAKSSSAFFNKTQTTATPANPNLEDKNSLDI